MDGAGESHSVTVNIAALKAGDDCAAAELWNRYFQQLVEAARRRLGSVPRRVADEEDVAISVFHTLCQGAKAGRFEHLTDRQDLWKLMVRITQHKVIDQIRYQHRARAGGGNVAGESVWLRPENEGGPCGIDQVMGAAPTPEFLVILEEQHRELLECLGDDTLRQIALWRMEAFSNEEIAQRLQISPRSVERKLKRIRECWEQRLQSRASG